MISVFDTVEIIVGKGENADYQHFLVFSQYFQKAFSLGVLKIRLCGNELTLHQTTIFWTRPNSKHLHMTNQHVAKIVISVFDMLKKHCGKRRKLPPFSTIFFFFHKVLKRLLSQG